MEKLIINKRMQNGETSKIEKYSKIVETLINKAKELNVDTIELSSEFTPILHLTDIKKEFPNYITGAYLFGTKNNIKFIISPDYKYAGKIGDLKIELKDKD